MHHVNTNKDNVIYMGTEANSLDRITLVGKNFIHIDSSIELQIICDSYSDNKIFLHKTHLNKINVSLNIVQRSNSSVYIEISPLPSDMMSIKINALLKQSAVFVLVGSSIGMPNTEHNIIIKTNNLKDSSSACINWRHVAYDKSKLELEATSSSYLYRSSIKQSLKALVLDGFPKLNLKPNLNLHVPCMLAEHGACITKIPVDICQYLTMRGITLSKARNLLTDCFLKEVGGVLEY